MHLFTGVRRRLLASVVLATVGIYTLGSGGGPTEARPPTSQMVIPPDAFRPIAILAPRTPEPTTVAILSPLSDPKRVSQPTRAPAALAAPEATPPPGPVHVVGAGDTLWEVAARHRVELASILRWNPSVDPRRLVTGQRVPVPGGGPMLTRRSTPRQKPTGQAPPPARLRMRVARQPSGSGEHLWPLPVRGTITNRFSAGHPAIDIAAPLGTSVRAIAAGTVIDAGWRNNGGGNVVVILHPDGMVSTYNHNRDVAVRRGQPVEPGQQIAWVGATGLATGPHLDLRIEMGGRLVNPLVVY